jgi:hypothetical protein
MAGFLLTEISLRSVLIAQGNENGEYETGEYSSQWTLAYIFREAIRMSASLIILPLLQETSASRFKIFRMRTRVSYLLHQQRCVPSPERTGLVAATLEQFKR